MLERERLLKGRIAADEEDSSPIVPCKRAVVYPYQITSKMEIIVYVVMFLALCP